MNWTEATIAPTEFKRYAVIANGKLQMADYHEFFYDVRMPRWSVDGVTHWAEVSVPSPQDIERVRYAIDALADGMTAEDPVATDFRA